MTAQEVLEAALDLELGERKQLVERLLENLASERGFVSDEIERDWLAEIARRSDEIDAGTAELVDWSEVRQKIAQWPDRT